jgi:cytochrome P450
LDILTILLSDDDRPDEDTMLAEAMLYFAASTGNMARMVPHCVSDLWAWLATIPVDQRPALDSTFLHAAAAETLRLHPSSPKIYRRAARETALASGTVIPAGSLVTMDVIAANRDLEVFGPDASRFDPYRTTGVDKRLWGMAFGDGVHKCIGEGMAAGSPAEAGRRTDGVIPLVVEALFELDIQPDPDRPATLHTVDRYNFYDTFPVRLSPPARQPHGDG